LFWQEEPLENRNTKRGPFRYSSSEYFSFRYSNLDTVPKGVMRLDAPCIGFPE
jgi:hypothetical protein